MIIFAIQEPEKIEEWLPDTIFEDLKRACPKGISMDSEYADWDKDRVTLHGYDDHLNSIAFVVFYFNLETGIINNVETEAIPE
jgi:hypothetical protein